MKNAFSLVELSIVLVILGLLTGGILAGQSLIHAAELRAVSTEYSRYVAAAQAFRDKYFQLPGDMSNAQSFWGVAHATPATCVTTASTTALTCNGNGDGQVIPSTGSNEYFRFWQHLANAGLIEGSYSGITQGTNEYSLTAQNAPKGRMNSAFWMTGWLGNYTGNVGDLFAGDYGNILEVGGLLANNGPISPLLKPEEMWNIDTKMDDGKPATGKTITRLYSLCTNASGATDTASTYNLSSATLSCVAIFKQAY